MEGSCGTYGGVQKYRWALISSA